MSRRCRYILLSTTVVAVAAAGCLGWRNRAAHRAWQAMIPALPPAAGAAAPGLDARLQACMTRLRTWPPDRQALAEFAELCHANGALDGAVAGYRALIVLEPNEPRWPHLLASILAGYGRLDEALPWLRRTTVLAPDHPIAWLRLGEALLKSNATDEAEAAYREALRRSPGNAYALVGLARCALQTGRWTDARRRLEQAVAAHPDSASAQSLLATVFERLGNPAAAAAARDRVKDGGHYVEPPDAWSDGLIAYCHNPYTLLTTAAAAIADGTPRRALAPLKRALALAPDDARLHRQLGKARGQLGDAAGARTQLERAVALAPDDETMHQDLIALLRSQGDEPAAERAVARGVAACPGSAALQFEAGLIAEREGRLDEAARRFEFTRRSRPDQTAAAVKLAAVQFEAGRGAAGVEVLEDVIRHHPDDRAALLLLARHGIETGDARAAGWLKRAGAAGGSAIVLAELERNYRRRFGATP
jgi:predicted Zn-dependent protease